jgi:hypothetical protein
LFLAECVRVVASIRIAMDPDLTTLRAALQLGCKVNAVRVGDAVTELVLVPDVGDKATIIRNPSSDVLLEYMRCCLQVNLAHTLQQKYHRAPPTRDLCDVIAAGVNEELRGLPGTAEVLANPQRPGELEIRILTHHTPTMRSCFHTQMVRIVDEDGVPVDLSEYTAEAEVRVPNGVSSGQVEEDHGKCPTETHQQDGDDHTREGC